MKPTDIPLVYTGREAVVGGGGLGFPTLLLQFPHDTVRRVDVDDLGLVLAVDLGVEEAVENGVVGGEISGDGEGDNVPSHFGIPSFPLSVLIIAHYMLQIKV